ncbi:unnamed protein product [Dovyalis caffra]|uniref:GATA-type domain-containing protein n=1 Tax=Dovyalis caffra TaxID=77055 RepID=A0AAV1RWH1_9ROSI|nr:unnamed protein product [Dovyalis caffra]
MDLRGRKSSREDDKSNASGGGVEDKRACTDCKTTKTPLWRGGPAGPKTFSLDLISLCNACGIRYRKKRTAVGLEKGPEKKREKTQITSNSTSASNSSNSTTAAGTTSTVKVGSGNGVISESLRMSLIVLGEEMILQRSSIVKKQRCRRKRKLREEEQAAFSLMALSCGTVFA